jgi:uncharacterized membrane protein YbhN (UPF0104 family)
LLTSGVALATIVPSGPGFVGTFELTVVAIADSLGIPRESAFALGLLVHVMILATTTIGGVIGLVALRRRGPASEANTGEGANVAPTSSAPSERLGKPGGEPTR